MTTTEQRIDFWNLTVRRVHGKSDQWVWCELSRIGVPPGYEKVVGCEPAGVYRSGPRKGKLKWPPENKRETVFVTRDQLAETELLWEEETGLCSRCVGEGKTICRTYRDDDGYHKEYSTCTKCGGDGKAKKPSDAATTERQRKERT